MIKLRLMNGAEVEVSKEEISEFITQFLTSNPDWRHSGLLTDGEVLRYFDRKSSPDELIKIARYILIYMENISFTAYLFDKAEGHPGQGKEFNLPVVKKLRELYRLAKEMATSQEEREGDVHQMESLCLEIGADPF